MIMAENENTPVVDSLSVGELITISELARRCGFNHNYLQMLVGKGRIKAVKQNRIWYTTMAAFQEYKDGRDMSHVLPQYRNR